MGGYPGARGSPWTLRIYFADGSVCVCVRALGLRLRNTLFYGVVLRGTL